MTCFALCGQNNVCQLTGEMPLSFPSLRRVTCPCRCDNWRGISLLDVVGEVFTKVEQDCLQDVVEDVVSESQCGFCKERGCTDMIYCARQLVEKAREHDASACVHALH